MKYHIATAGLLMVALASTAMAQSPGGDSATRLQGVWRMTSLEQGTPGSDLSAVDFTGQIVFTDNGVVAVQAMKTSGDDPGNPYAVNGYEAYYGAYDVAADGTVVTFDVQSSVVRDLIGRKLERAIEVTDDRLVITPTSKDENWRVTYERQD
ncbi:lipocalin-like domain-containing protein [Aureimonas phyllosphaerae]|uniref:lipocalin-like domain-containing protein n=1 Tax=Aureimonas phyllosphaerae TaxID=1166078 RepID=UPI003A5BE6E8